MTTRVLVTGASGKIGSELVKLLAASELAVRAATRRPHALAGQLGRSAEIVQFDFERAETFAPVLEGVDRLFLIARPGDNRSDEVAAPFIDQAKLAGVSSIVDVTAIGVESDESFMLRKLERYVERSGIPYTHLRPNWFMQVFSSGPMLADIRATGALHLPAADATISFIDVRDVAAAAHAVLTQPHGTEKAFTLTGSASLSHFEVVEKISAAACRKITYVPLTEEAARAGLLARGIPSELVDRWTEFYRKIRAGFCSAVSPDTETLLARPPLAFDQYARDNADAWR